MSLDNAGTNCKFRTICVGSVRCGAYSEKDMFCYRKESLTDKYNKKKDYYFYLSNLRLQLKKIEED